MLTLMADEVGCRLPTMNVVTELCDLTAGDVPSVAPVGGLLDQVMLARSARSKGMSAFVHSCTPQYVNKTRYQGSLP